VAQLKASEMATKATMKETCEKCGRKEVRYSEQQLRGADEGSTIFYECDCGHKYVWRR
jgi:DNA-directed RNA polymerase I subunit RPA12